MPARQSFNTWITWFIGGGTHGPDLVSPSAWPACAFWARRRDGDRVFAPRGDACNFLVRISDTGWCRGAGRVRRDFYAGRADVLVRGRHGIGRPPRVPLASRTSDRLGLAAAAYVGSLRVVDPSQPCDLLVHSCHGCPR